MKTDKQKLEAILAFLEKKGWDFWGLRDEKNFSYGVCENNIINCFGAEFSQNDLLASHSMWEKLAGKHSVCDQCGYDLHYNSIKVEAAKLLGKKRSEIIAEDDICYEHIKGGYTPIPANIYHISQCFQLPEEERLKYAHQFVKKINND